MDLSEKIDLEVFERYKKYNFDTYVKLITDYYNEKLKGHGFNVDKNKEIEIKMANKLVSVYNEALNEKKISVNKYITDLLHRDKLTISKEAKYIYNAAVDILKKIDKEKKALDNERRKDSDIEQLSDKQMEKIREAVNMSASKRNAKKWELDIINAKLEELAKRNAISKDKFNRRFSHDNIHPEHQVDYSDQRPPEHQVHPQKKKEKNYDDVPSEYRWYGYRGGYLHNKAMTIKDIKELCKANQIKLSKVVDNKRVVYKKKELITRLKRKKLL